MKAFLVFLLVCSGCRGGGGLELALRTGLGVIHDVVAPASKLSKDGCTVRETMIVSERRAGKLSEAQADQEMAMTRKRCDALWATFDAIRDAHDAAATLVEQGALEQAEEKLAQARAMFRGLSSQLEDAP